jgi:hypothetical protein
MRFLILYLSTIYIAGASSAKEEELNQELIRVKNQIKEFKAQVKSKMILKEDAHAA